MNEEYKKYHNTQKKTETKEMIFGFHSVEETIKSGNEIEKIYISKTHHNLNEVKALAHARNIPISIVPDEKLDRLTHKNHQGIICFASPIRYSKIENIIMNCFDKGENPLVLILDRITDVRNFGAIARTAECAGVHAIVIPSKGAALITADAVKTSSGALNFIPVCREENLRNTIKYLKDSGLQIIGCTEKAGDYLYKTELHPPTAIILGSEEDGIATDLLKSCDHLTLIPIKGEVKSLNVSVAAGVIIYEALRQRIINK